jgi:ferredoxin
MSNAFTESLEKYRESDWLAAVEAVSGEIHEVDRAATQIWFRFFPLDLVRHLEAAEDVEGAMKGVALEGDFGLVDKIDTSHFFLYGHRYWPQVKAAVETRAEKVEAAADLATEIRAVANAAAASAKVDASLTMGIAAAGLMTLVQAGYDELKSAAGTIEKTLKTKDSGNMTKSPDDIVAARAKDDSQGLLGFLKTIDKEFSVRFKAFKYDGKFKIMNLEEIASASQKDRSKAWQDSDPRCWEGPVPIECTSASCGTCWVGVVGGKEKLTEPSPRERRAMRVFGYNQPDDEKPMLRLACQAKATGNVSIIIPPWNAVFGKKVRGNVEDAELEPVTTSAKKLREVVKEATSN